ncbi:MAG: hypothetical protein FWD71_19895 [Oscillospiraceae bacterium]|nr:hypothetical protein [Oscillospiraceae bacterium]
MEKFLTSRQRLINAIEKKRTDRVPVSTYELCARNSYSFENNEPSYSGLMAFIKENTDAVTMWDLGSNGRFVNSSYSPDVKIDYGDEGNYHVQHLALNANGRILTQTLKWSDNVKTTWNVEHICKNTNDVDALMNLPYEPVTYNASDYARISAETGDGGIIMSSVSDPAGTAIDFMEFGDATVWALTEPNHFQSVLDELHRRNMINMKNMLETQTVDLYRICGAEYVTPPYLPPSCFEKFEYPYLCDIVGLLHKYGAKARIHCHGKIRHVLDMIIATGADAIDPCEAPPDGDITLSEIKEKTAGKLCIFGNLQLKLLECGSTDEVREYVKNCMLSAKEGGGYVIMPTAAPIDIPLSPKTEANYRTFINTALEFGRY